MNYHGFWVPLATRATPTKMNYEINKRLTHDLQVLKKELTEKLPLDIVARWKRDRGSVGLRVAGMKERTMKLVNYKKFNSESLTGLTYLIVLIFLTLPTAAFSEDVPVVTQHQAHIGGKLLKYAAEAGRIAICDVETGEPHGYMFYTAYRIPSASGPRPVTFVWNGGPGADSALLHFSIVGPKLAAERTPCRQS